MLFKEFVLALYMQFCICVSIKFGKLEWDIKLTGHCFGKMIKKSLNSCAQECFIKTRCLLFNYYRTLLLCQFNSQTLLSYSNKTGTNKNSIYSDITTWKRVSKTDSSLTSNVSVYSMYLRFHTRILFITVEIL